MYRSGAPASTSTSSVSSLSSFLSDDSYLNKLKPVDAGFAAMMAEVRALDTQRNILLERKLQSHMQKRRDQTDTARREDWTEAQEREYAAYKATVKALEDANRKAAASTAAARARGDEENCRKALEDQRARSGAAIRAAEARLSFMTRYPNAYSTPSHRGHIAAVEGNLNSAKLAQREIQNQQKKLDAVTKRR